MTKHCCYNCQTWNVVAMIPNSLSHDHYTGFCPKWHVYKAAHDWCKEHKRVNNKPPVAEATTGEA